jgi:hypothetical protein
MMTSSKPTSGCVTSWYVPGAGSCRRPALLSSDRPFGSWRNSPERNCVHYDSQRCFHTDSPRRAHQYDRWDIVYMWSFADG